MQQIRNILAVDFEKFAQVMQSTEITNAGFNLINETTFTQLIFPIQLKTRLNFIDNIFVSINLIFIY
jgi:hypothetical protein